MIVVEGDETMDFILIKPFHHVLQPHLPIYTMERENECHSHLHPTLKLSAKLLASKDKCWDGVRMGESVVHLTLSHPRIIHPRSQSRFQD